MASTSLAEQLKRLAVPQTSILVHSKKRDSLLFDPKDAADIDRDTFYNIGLNGLEELKEIDSRFSEFKKSLFDETSMHLERAVEDQQANTKLDQLINRFLILLSPYVNLKAAHQTLEWLICRFHIHQYNTDTVLALFLPYYNTNIFARVIQILPVTGRWIWLQTLKKEGIPMSKSFLLSRASSDTSFFKFICNLPLQGVQVHGEKSVCLTTLFSFYCTTVIGALDQTVQVSEVLVSHLLPSLIAGINSSHLDFTASSLMILGHLVTKIRLTPAIYSELFFKVCRCEQPLLRNEVALVLVVMAQSGRPPPLLPSITHLAQSPWFMPAISALATSGIVVFPLVTAFLSDILTAIKNQENILQETLQDFMIKLIKAIHFSTDEAEKLLITLAESPLAACEWHHMTLHHLEKAYPEAFDRVAKSHSSLFPEYLARNDLFVRLNHPEVEVRLQALLHVTEQKHLLKEEWMCEGLLNRLTDDSTKVVAAALHVCSSLPRKRLADTLVHVLSRAWHSSGGLYTLGPIILTRLHATNRTDIPTLLLLTLPFLIPSDASHLSTAKAVLKCKFVTEASVFQPLLKKVGDNVTETKLCKEVYKFMEKGLKDIKLRAVLAAARRLEDKGPVYQLISMTIAAGCLPPTTPPPDLNELLQHVKDYNASPKISSEIHEELSDKNLPLVVSACRRGKLPFQGSLHLVSTLVAKLASLLSGVECREICNVRQPPLALITDILKLVLQIKESKNIYIARAYSRFCDALFEKCVDAEGQIDLLSNMSLGCPDISADCLHHITQLVDQLSTAHETVLVPALLVGLSSTLDQTRYNSLKLLRSLTQKLALPTYCQLLHKLTQWEQEITMDSEQINVALYMCLSPDLSVQALLDRSLRQDMAKVLTKLMDIVSAQRTPVYVKASLLKILDQVNSQNLLEQLVPLAVDIIRKEQASPEEWGVVEAIIRRVNVTTASAFDNPPVWNLVNTCFASPKTFKAAILLLNQIDRDLFVTLSVKDQQRLLSSIIEYVAETENSDVSSVAASCVKHVALNATIVAALLEPMRDVTIETPNQSTKKRGWSVKKPPPLELLTTSQWKRGLCLLEFIQNKKKLDNIYTLLPRLFEILNKCLLFEEQAPVEYTKQVLLTALLQCCSKLPSPAPPDLPEASVQVDLVVECIRVSSNPQTHHHALLLLTHIAKMIPERVLHSIMPIFTFMGSSVLRQDDAYSFQIISKVLETIVPVLMKSGVEDGEDDEQLTGEVVTVLRVFAGALLDIPEHRRTPLFTKLLSTLHDGRLLWAFLALVCESHVLHTTAKESGAIPKRLEVTLQLCHQFPRVTVLLAARNLIHFLCILPPDKADKKKDKFKKSRLGALFDMDSATDKQLRHFTYTVLTFLSLLLSSKEFLRLMATLTSEEILSLKNIFEQMFEGILKYTECVWKQVEATKGQQTNKYWNSMFNICFDVLAKTNALLPGDMFLAVISTLIDHQLLSLRCKTLELLNWRLQQSQPMDPGQLLALVPSLLRMAKGGDTHADAYVTQQTALLSLKFLARQLAADHPDEFHPVFKTATKMIRRGSVPEPVLASAVLCVGELCHSLGAHAIPALPTFLPPVIAVMENRSSIESGDLVLASVVSALLKVVESLACFLSPYLDQLLIHLSVLSADCSRHSDNVKLQPIVQKIKLIRQKISGEVPLRALLPAVRDSYSQLVSDRRTSAVPALLSVLADSFQAGSQLTPELTSFFLTALDFRSQTTSPSPSDVAVVEPAVISTILSLVFKLSESSFRPFYYKLFNWAFRSDAPRDRSITFYKLTCIIAESLKGLFVSFAHYFLQNAATLLDEHNTSKILGEENVEPEEEKEKWKTDKAQELIDAVLRSLLTVFIHDASHFINKERFDTLMQPIVDQLENQLGGEEISAQRMTELVTPCLAQMAVCAADDTLWKQLNYQVLLKTRHQVPQVRIGGVLTVCEIAKKLGEEFLPLLPETVPFLAELLEDENENVEKTTQTVVQELEATLGEPISKYF